MRNLARKLRVAPVALITAMAGLFTVAPATPAHADVVSSGPIPVRLGFGGTFSLGDPPAFSSSGFDLDVGPITASVTADIGATVSFSYDRADVIPGQNVPVTITYTPTSDPGADLSINATADVFVDCSVCQSATLNNFTLISGSGDFVAPLSGDAPVNIPLSSDTILIEDPIFGTDLVSGSLSGTLTLAPVGPSLPGLGGAAAGVGVTGASLAGLPVVEWDTAGQSVVAQVMVPATGAPFTTTLSPLFHWLDVSASVNANVSIIDPIPDPDPISIFAGSLGPLFTQAGLDTAVADAVTAATGNETIGAAIGTAIGAGRLPIPLLSPEVPSVPPLPAIGSVPFTIDPDSDDDGLLDGVEITGANPTNPDDPDSDNDGLNDGTEDTNKNGALDVGETNPNNPDSDADLLTDGCEVNGTNPTNPVDADTDDDTLTDGQEDADKDCSLADVGVTETDPNNADTDGDGLNDALEPQLGTNPLDPDTDDDGIPDGQDTEFIESAINALPDSAFKALGLRTALLTRLGTVQEWVADGKVDQALSQLDAISQKLDGCGTQPDGNDWIIDCTAQVQIRHLVDILVTNLMS
jgi:Bacterial TSP3 repeat